MLCHECLILGEERPAVALCKFCQVGLCKQHLVALYREPATVPQYSCQHNPAGLPGRGIEVKTAFRENEVIASVPEVLVPALKR
jgi:hypothetical protein